MVSLNLVSSPIFGAYWKRTSGLKRLISPHGPHPTLPNYAHYIGSMLEATDVFDIQTPVREWGMGKGIVKAPTIYYAYTSKGLYRQIHLFNILYIYGYTVFFIFFIFYSHYARWAGGLCRATPMYECLRVSTKYKFS